uniref:Anaphase-promoting complex subunit 1 C-terminal domain-containing protein n=1 Tax=Opuntia streptacantha TaxID=393608 RepID=A0A7C9AEP2_OPUST
MSFYAIIRSMTDQVTSEIVLSSDSLSLSHLKLVVAYNEALLRGRLTTSRDGIVQSKFLGSLRKRIEELLNYSQDVKTDLHTYFASGKWPDDKLRGEKCLLLLSWFLQWFSVPPPSVVQQALAKIKPKLKTSSSVPLLRLMLPRTHATVISEMSRSLLSA